MQIEINDLFQKALDLLEKTQKNVFITGKAGTGKSTLLDYFRNRDEKRIVVLAPTGVAAINVQGETIHSFFGFKPDITLEKVRRIEFKDERDNIYRQLEAVVIDEISMVRADLLDCVDKFLRLNGPNEKKPFGGLQMIFFGDLYQLPPVVTGQERQIFRGHYESEYFFSAKVFKNISMEYLELEKVYRQRDEKFVSLLNSIRNNTAGETELSELNKRVQQDYEPKGNYSIILTTTNRMAKETNDRKLNELHGKTKTFEGWMNGHFDQNQLPTEIELKLKKGAQVMMLNNDQLGRWVNGTMAKIKSVRRDEIVIRLQDGEVYEVEPYTWEIFHFNYNPKSRRIESEATASFTQFPLKLAWAITIHKSQGKTFDNAVIDIGNGTFAHGQMYVALSRCRSLEGMVLKKPIKKGHIFMDWRVVKFVTGYQYQLSEESCSLDDKILIIARAIDEKNKLEVVYLKAQDVKSKRVIEPLEVGEMEYNGKPFFGIRAFCHQQQDERVFRVDRILEMRVVETK